MSFVSHAIHSAQQQMENAFLHSQNADLQSENADLHNQIDSQADQLSTENDFLGDINDLSKQLLSDNDESTLSQALTALVTELHANSLIDTIESSDLSDGVKEMLTDLLDTIVSDAKSELSDLSDTFTEALSTFTGSTDDGASASTDTEATTGSTDTESTSDASTATDDAASTDEAASAAGATTAENLDDDVEKGDSDKGLNWLEILAKGMAEIESKWAVKAQDAQKTMNTATDEAEGTAPSSKFLEAQSEYTAANQMFSMMANASSTSIKTLGEALTGLDRKQ